MDTKPGGNIECFWQCSVYKHVVCKRSLHSRAGVSQHESDKEVLRFMCMTVGKGLMKAVY